MYTSSNHRAGLTIGQPSKCPGPRTCISKHSLLVFHVFRLFSTRQNFRAFRLLRLIYRLRTLTTLEFIVFEWLQRVEPNSTTLYDRRIEICASMGVLRFFSRGGQHRNFAYPFQVADDAMQMDVYKTLCTFYPISLCWLNLNSQSFVWNVFYTSAIRNTFSFHKHLNIH